MTQYDEEHPLTAMSDAVLIRRFRGGDVASFEVLFERHYGMVYGVAFRLTGTRAEAEDLAQEVFLKLYRRPLGREENVAGWLYRVAVNAGYNALKARERRQRRERRVGEQWLEPPPPPDVQAAVQETRREVREALARIPQRAARLLILREMGFSYQELAAMAGVAPGSVGKLLERAREAFEKALAARQAAGRRREEEEDAASE